MAGNLLREVEIAKRWPCTDEFDPEELADQLKRRGGVETIIYKGMRYGWIGNQGSLMYAPDGMKRSFVRCAEVHGEDAAKIWAWLQGWIVGQSTHYVERFKEELADGKSDDDVSGSEATPVQPTRDWKRESSGEGLDDTEDELPF